MQIGFYAPLKAPNHPVPSGDRQMARLLIEALRLGGHAVSLISTFRCFSATPDDAERARIAEGARDEVASIAAQWGDRPALTPDLIFAYHLYYKAPDLIGAALARRFDLPYVTAEASHAAKREGGPWQAGHALVEAAIREAAVNFCFTANDRLGLAEIVHESDRLIDLPPFIETSRYTRSPHPETRHGTQLVTVAMMRPGDKLHSYRFLAAALMRLQHLDWRLTIIGDGPARSEVEAAFAPLPPDRLVWRGALAGDAVADALMTADLFVWPGFNEAFGLSYLEAQACGRPVIAVRGEGTPSVVRDGTTGLLTANHLADYAAAIARLLTDPALRAAFGEAASAFVHGERTLAGAAARLQSGLDRARQPMNGAAP
nr:glycosyltransferase family 4 protein [Lichenihabitans psoromatis]